MASREEAIGYLKALISAEKGERLPQPEFGKDRLRALEKIVEALEGEGGGGGSGGGVLMVHPNEVTGALDKTWQEIHDADFAVLKLPDGDLVRFAITSQVEEVEGVYGAIFVYFGKVPTPYVCITDSPDGYPSLRR